MKSKPEVELVAWIVDIFAFPEVVCFATSEAKAKWIAIKAYRNAGYGSRGSWPDIICKRGSDYDRFINRPDCAELSMFKSCFDKLTNEK